MMVIRQLKRQRRLLSRSVLNKEKKLPKLFASRRIQTQGTGVQTGMTNTEPR